MTALWLILIVPGLICAYAMVLRPFLHKIPAMQRFYKDADGFWAKVWAICGKSMTMLWGYVLGGLGAVLSLMQPIANAVGDPDLKDQVTNLLQSDPKILGYVTIGISVITIIARLRTIGKASA